MTSTRERLTTALRYDVLYALAAGATTNNLLAQPDWARKVTAADVRHIRREHRADIEAIRAGHSPSTAVKRFGARLRQAEDDAEKANGGRALIAETSLIEPPFGYEAVPTWRWVTGTVRLDGEPVFERATANSDWIANWRALGQPKAGLTIYLATFRGLAIDRARIANARAGDVVSIHNAPMEANWLWHLYLDEETEISNLGRDVPLTKPRISGGHRFEFLTIEALDELFTQKLQECPS